MNAFQNLHKPMFEGHFRPALEKKKKTLEYVVHIEIKCTCVEYKGEILVTMSEIVRKTHFVE